MNKFAVCCENADGDEVSDGVGDVGRPKTRSGSVVARCVRHRIVRYGKGGREKKT